MGFILQTCWRSRTCWVRSASRNGKSRPQGGAREEGAVSLIFDIAKAFDKVQWKAVDSGQCTSVFLRRILRILCGSFAHKRKLRLEDHISEPLPTITARLPGSKCSVLLLRIVMQEGRRTIFSCWWHQLTPLRSSSEELMERTRQLFNTMKAEMPKGMLEMSVGAWEEQEEDKSKYPMHFQEYN